MSPLSPLTDWPVEPDMDDIPGPLTGGPEEPVLVAQDPADWLSDEMLRRLEAVVDHANRRAKVPAGRLKAIAEITREKVQWIWPGRLARGKLHLLVGDPGIGKSFVTLDMAARITTGRPWPDGAPAAPVGNVIVLSSEDDAADTIRPRFEDMGGEIYRLYVQQGNPLSLQDDLKELEALIRATECALIVVDPINSYMGKIDSYKDADVRSILDPLARVAGETGAAVLAIMHMTKTPADPASAKRPDIYRILGSIGYVGAARMVMMVTAGEPKGTRLLGVIKTNLSTPAAVLAYRLDGPSSDHQVVVWEGVRDRVAADPQLEQDRQTLRGILAAGAVLAADGEKAAKAAGLTDRRLSEARKGVVESYRIPGMADTVWGWRLLSSVQQPPPP